MREKKSRVVLRREDRVSVFDGVYIEETDLQGLSSEWSRKPLIGRYWREKV